jgi:hypothetical protein
VVQLGEQAQQLVVDRCNGIDIVAPGVSPLRAGLVILYWLQDVQEQLVTYTGRGCIQAGDEKRLQQTFMLKWMDGSRAHIHACPMRMG